MLTQLAVRYMWSLHSATPEHWVPIKTVASFKRMREFAELGTPWIAEALKSSTALEVDETNEKVRRRTEVTEPKGQFERSIYAVSFTSGFYTTSLTLIDVTERVWRREPPVATKARRFLQSIRADRGCAHAARR